LVAEDDAAVGRVGGITVPFAPPSGTGVAGGTVVGVAAVKVNGECTTGVAVGRGGV
jgi:hypothetical protein